VQGVPTTEIHVVKFAADGTTVLAERTVNYAWMETNLPVYGDGVTHYYHQGPVFVEEKEGQWDRNETENFKDRGAVKGTNLKDLCDLVGGMTKGDEVMIHAVDGYHIEFGYDNVYTYAPRQGPMVLCWHNAEDAPVGERQGVGYPPEYYAGMRLVFFADTSGNSAGEHIFGNWDMHEVMPAEAIHLFDNLYPSTSGYNVKWVDEVRIYAGGYGGQKGTTVKSLDNKSLEGKIAQPTPAAPLGSLLATIGLLIVVLLYRRT
jgi:hypothetical protein